jgi:hypothetical protein
MGLISKSMRVNSVYCGVPSANFAHGGELISYKSRIRYERLNDHAKNKIKKGKKVKTIVKGGREGRLTFKKGLSRIS